MWSVYFMQGSRLAMCIAGSVALIAAAGFAQAQQSPSTNVAAAKVPKETVLYTFTGGADGRSPQAGLIFDSSRVLYGTTVYGGTLNSGTVYKLTPPASGGMPWTQTVLHSFSSAPDGVSPFAGVIFGSDGALYGTTRGGGSCQGCGGGFGTVYKLAPPPSGTPSGTPWTETVLYYFMGGADGGGPDGGVIIDDHGTLYGTTSGGGAGTVYKLTPPANRTPPGTPWTETVLHNFSSVPDGANPFAGVIFDRHGTLYGTTRGGGASDYGTVFTVSVPGDGDH